MGELEASVRRHWKGIVVTLVALWLLGAVAVGFFGGLGAATRSGAAVARTAQYQRYLGRGWLAPEAEELAPATATTPEAFIGLNYSNGRTSTVDPDPAWRVLRLRLAPIPCPDGASQSIAVSQGTRRLLRLTPPVAWATYSVPLVHPGHPVTLTYRCVTDQPETSLGPRALRRLAILLAGVSGTR